MKVQYKAKSFRGQSLGLLEKLVAVTDQYRAEGYTLTVRQAYYQMVARGHIENRQAEYRRVAGLIADGRMAGLIDWDAIEDRTRETRVPSTWASPASILRSAARWYREDLLAGQKTVPELWIEKDALVGILGAPMDALHVPLLSTRGYLSLSEMREAAMRILRRERSGQKTVIIHMSDHDPSGIDMTRDIGERLSDFDAYPTVIREALTMEQVRKYDPPPNPAKVEDSRYEAYVAEYGGESWELDAIEPKELERIAMEAARAHIDEKLMRRAKAHQEEGRERLEEIAEDEGTDGGEM